MAIRKLFIQCREYIPEVARILETNVIGVEYEFEKAQILGQVCMFDVDISPEQEAAVHRAAVRRMPTDTQVFDAVKPVPNART